MRRKIRAHVRIFSCCSRRKSIGGIWPINRNLGAGTVRQKVKKRGRCVVERPRGRRRRWRSVASRIGAWICVSVNVARHAVKNVFCNWTCRLPFPTSFSFLENYSTLFFFIFESVLLFEVLTVKFSRLFFIQNFDHLLNRSIKFYMKLKNCVVL